MTEQMHTPTALVKPLEWDGHDYAKAFGWVWSVHRAYGMWFWERQGRRDETPYETNEAAKAAAQADYSACILSALSQQVQS